MLNIYLIDKANSDNFLSFASIYFSHINNDFVTIVDCFLVSFLIQDRRRFYEIKFNASYLRNAVGNCEMYVCNRTHCAWLDA